MTAWQSILCGEIQKNVEYRETKFEMYDEGRGVVMKWAINKKIENERAGFDPMDCNVTGSNQEDWWIAEWPTPEELQPTTDLDYAGKGKGDGEGKGKGEGMQFGGKGRMNPMQMMMAAINANKGGGKGFNNKNNYNNSNKGGIKGGK